MRVRGAVWLLALGLGACRSTEHPSKSASSTAHAEQAPAATDAAPAPKSLPDEPGSVPAASSSAAPPPAAGPDADELASDAAPHAAPPDAGEPAQPKAEPTAYRIAALGDSLTDPRSHGGGYLDYVLERCPESRVENFGKGGYMINQMRRRFEREVLPQSARFTHLVVFGGVNDLYSDLTAKRTNERIQRDLTAIYAQARAKGLKVVAITVAPWGGFKRYFTARRGRNTLLLNEWIGQQQTDGKIDVVVDSYPLLSCGEPERLCADYEIFSKDGLHFNARAHEVLGKALYERAFASCK